MILHSQSGNVAYYKFQNGFIGELNVGGFNPFGRFMIKTYRTPVADTQKSAERFVATHIMPLFNQRRLV